MHVAVGRSHPVICVLCRFPQSVLPHDVPPPRDVSVSRRATAGFKFKSILTTAVCAALLPDSLPHSHSTALPFAHPLPETGPCFRARLRPRARPCARRRARRCPCACCPCAPGPQKARKRPAPGPQKAPRGRPRSCPPGPPRTCPRGRPRTCLRTKCRCWPRHTHGTLTPLTPICLMSHTSNLQSYSPIHI